MTRDEIAVKAIRDAAAKVQDLLNRVDEGKIPMLVYLKRLEKRLRGQAYELEDRCNRESGG